MKNYFKYTFILFLLVLCINDAYADDVKFTCVYEDFQINKNTGGEKYGKGLQVDVYDSKVIAWATYIDDDGSSKQCNLNDDEDCKYFLDLWELPSFQLQMVLNEPSSFYKDNTPYCPNVVVDRGKESKMIYVTFGETKLTQYTTTHSPKKTWPHGEASNNDENILECTKEKGYSYSFSTSEVPDAAYEQINFEFLKKKSGDIIIRINYGNDASNWDTITAGSSNTKELQFGMPSVPKVTFDKFGTFDTCPKQSDLSFCEADIAGEDFKTYTLTLNSAVCKNTSTKIPGYDNKIDAPKELGCESIFKGDLQTYMEKIFSIMKYAGIVFCIGFSIADFVKAILDEDKGALNKIAKKVVTRLFLVALLFFLPTIVNFVVKIIDDNACTIDF